MGSRHPLTPLVLLFPHLRSPEAEASFLSVPSDPKLTSKPGTLEQTGSHVPSCLQQGDTIHIPHLVLPGENTHEAANASETLVELHQTTLGKDLHLSPSAFHRVLAMCMVWGSGDRGKGAVLGLPGVCGAVHPLCAGSDPSAGDG